MMPSLVNLVSLSLSSMFVKPHEISLQESNTFRDLSDNFISAVAILGPQNQLNTLYDCTALSLVTSFDAACMMISAFYCHLKQRFQDVAFLFGIHSGS